MGYDFVDWAGRVRGANPGRDYLALFVPYDRQNKAETMKRESFFCLGDLAAIQDGRSPLIVTRRPERVCG